MDAKTDATDATLPQASDDDERAPLMGSRAASVMSAASDAARTVREKVVTAAEVAVEIGQDVAEIAVDVAIDAKDVAVVVHETVRQRIHRELETNIIFLTLISVAIVLSTFAFCAETVPSLQSEYSREFSLAEVCFVGLFSFEYVVRIVATEENKLVWLLEPMNVIDLLAILPFYIEAGLLAPYGISADIVDLRWLRALRLMRLGKFARQSQELRIIGTALRDSTAALVVLFATLFIGVMVFATIIFVAERGEYDEDLGCHVRYDGACSPFKSIPEASWWAIVSITTVGYGDSFPISTQGRIVGAVVMTTGILVLALPSTVLSMQFTDAYSSVSERMALEDARNFYYGKRSLLERHLTDARAQSFAGLEQMNVLESEMGRIMERVCADKNFDINVGLRMKLMQEDTIQMTKRMSDYADLHESTVCNDGWLSARREDIRSSLKSAREEIVAVVDEVRPANSARS